MNNKTAPIVFISYCWTNEDHKSWVLDLATALRSSGVDIQLDRWELKGGHDTIDFMEEMVKNPDVERVLVICDQGYQEKADKRQGGVGIESQIISGEIYKNIKQEKFIPIVRERDREGKETLPVYLKNRMYIDFSDDTKYGEKFEELLREIFKKPALEKPALGTPPSFTDDTKRHLPTFASWSMFKNAILGDKTTAYGIFTELMNAFVDMINEFALINDDLEDKEMGQYAHEQISAMLPYRDHFIEILDFLATYKEDIRFYEEIHRLFERIWIFTQPSENTRTFNIEPMKYFIYELFIYTIAILINHRKFEQANYFLSEPYYLDTVFKNNKSQPYWEFDYSLPKLDVFVNNQYKLRNTIRTNLKFPISQLVNDRATLTNIPMIKLIEVEIVLWLRDFRWRAYSLVYRNGNSLDLFQRASSKRGFKNLLLLLDYQDKQEFEEKIQEVLASRSLRELGILFSDEFADIINLNNLGTI